MRVSQTLVFAALMLTAPAIGALAQSANPTGNNGSNGSMTASPGTADSQAASGMHTGDVGHGSGYSPTRPTTDGTAATNPSRSGATGQAVVPGNASTAADTSGATRNTQTGGASSGATSGGGNK
jgi:hypothetical protein